MAPGERDVVGDPEADPESPGLADRYRVLIEHSPDAIVVHRRGNLVYVNPAGLRYLRADSLGAVVGRPITGAEDPRAAAQAIAEEIALL